MPAGTAGFAQHGLTTMPPGASLSQIALKLAAAALPVTAAGRLLMALTDAWRMVIPEGTAFVAFACGDRLIGCSLSGAMNCEPITLPSPLGWSSATALEAMLQRDGDPVRLASSLTVLPFEFENRTLGAVLISGRSPKQDCSMLADLSARLIAQLHHINGPTTADSCRDSLACEATGSPLGSGPDADSSMPADAVIPGTDPRTRHELLEAMAEFCAGAGHEINNPIATIAGRAALLLKNETQPQRQRALETIGAQALRVRDMIGDAMTFARPPVPVPQSFVPTVAVREVIERLQDQFERTGIELACTLDEELVLQADREQFEVVVSCLLRNCVDAMPDGGRVRVSLRPTPIQTRFGVNPSVDASAGDAICGGCELTVSDNGPGLSDVDARHLFNPFYSGRQAGRGLGFGLAKCWRILEAHGGTLAAISPDDGGLQITAHWPAAIPSQPSSGEPAERSASTR